MILTVRVRLTKPILGELRPDNRGVRRFKMAHGQIVVNAHAWRQQFALAARQLGYAIDLSTIVPPETYRPATIHLWPRNISRVKMEMYEAFRGGTVLTWEFLIREDLPKSPQPLELKAIFRITGEYFGLSQFDNESGFGRFKVLSIEPKDLQQYATENNLEAAEV